jgi:predicted porin
MKKHLIAAAVAGALAVPAMAQVTISGAIETGYQSVEKTATWKKTGVNGADNGSMTGTPNITFSASEDLGGGLTAGATIQKVFEAGPGTDAGDFKVAKVALSGGFGTIAIGRDSDNAQEAGASYRFFGDIGRTSLRTGTWQTNTIQYTSPSFSGFSVGLFTQIQGDTNATTEADKANSVILKGSISGLNLGLSSQTYETGAGVKDKRTNISAGYDLGMAKVGVAYFELKDGSEDDEKSKMTGVHLAVPLSSALSVGLAMNQYKDDADKADTTHFAVKYALSKRTSLNFAYETVKTGASGVPTGINTESATDLTPVTNGLETGFIAGETTKGYGFSISHSF